jgi:hypothetical protein
MERRQSRKSEGLQTSDTAEQGKEFECCAVYSFFQSVFYCLKPIPFNGLSSFPSAMTPVFPHNRHFNPICDVTHCFLLGTLLCSSEGSIKKEQRKSPAESGLGKSTGCALKALIKSMPLPILSTKQGEEGKGVVCSLPTP